MSSDVTVAACDDSTLRATLAWLYRELSPVERAVQIEAAATELGIDDLLAATRGGTIIGTIVTQVAAGQVGWLFEPTVADASPGAPGSTPSSGVLSRLIAAGVSRLNRAGVRIVQALIPLDSGCGELLEQLGFRRITEMIRMVRRDDARRDSAWESFDLDFLPFAEERRGIFEDVLRKTYEFSRDCPELDGVRPESEILIGYRACGDFRPGLWQLASRGGEFVACLLLAEFAGEHRCELQYMGVIPAARGWRLGASLCARAISLTIESGANELWLSVDARNDVAIRHYLAAGFDEVDRRRVYILRAGVAATIR